MVRRVKLRSRRQGWRTGCRVLACALLPLVGACVVWVRSGARRQASDRPTVEVCAPQRALSRSEVACLVRDAFDGQAIESGAFNDALSIRGAQDVIRHFGCLAERESGRGRLRCGQGGEGLFGINRMHLRGDLPGCEGDLEALRQDDALNARCAVALYRAKKGFWHWGRPSWSGYPATDWGTNRVCRPALRAEFPVCKR